MVYWQLESCSSHSPCTPQQQHPSDKRNSNKLFKFAFPWGNPCNTQLQMACSQLLLNLSRLNNQHVCRHGNHSRGSQTLNRQKCSSHAHLPPPSNTSPSPWSDTRNFDSSSHCRHGQGPAHFSCLLEPQTNHGGAFFGVIRGTQRGQLVCCVFCFPAPTMPIYRDTNWWTLFISGPQPSAAPTCSIPQAQLWDQLPGPGTVCCSMFSLTLHRLRPPRGFQQYK